MGYFPITYNTGTTISGTTKYDDINVGPENFDISQHPQFDWYYSPSNALGWTIFTDTGRVFNDPNPKPTFWRSPDFTAGSLINLINQLPNRNGIVPPLTTSGDAMSFLSSNNYFTNEPVSFTPTIMDFQTTSSNETITLPFIPRGYYEGTINWGDGTTSESFYGNRAHVYATAGTYSVTVSGRFEGFTFEPGFGSSFTKVVKISQFGSVLFQSDRQGCDSIFQGTASLNLTTVSDVPNTSGFTNWNEMFRDRTSTSFVNRLNEWDSRNSTYMGQMFHRAFQFNQNIGAWDVSKVQSFYAMFFRSNQYNNGGSPDINNWNTSSANDMSLMFYQAPFNQPLSGWNVSNVTNMSQMLQQTPFNQNINSWNVSKVTNMFAMFYFNSTFNQPCNNWNTSACTNMSLMFYGSTNFDQNIGNWDVSNVTNFDNFMGIKTDLTFSSANLDAIYNGWSSRPVKPNISISFGTAKHSSASASGRAILTGAPNNWTIIDGGQTT